MLDAYNSSPLLVFPISSYQMGKEVNNLRPFLEINAHNFLPSIVVGVSDLSQRGEEFVVISQDQRLQVLPSFSPPSSSLHSEDGSQLDLPFDCAAPPYEHDGPPDGDSAHRTTREMHRWPLVCSCDRPSILAGDVQQSCS